MKELLHRDGTPMRKYSSPLINELNEEIMNEGLNKILSRLDDAVFNIEIKVKAINDKLDELIKALHEYDGDEWDEPNDALKEAAAQYNERMHHVSNEEADEDAATFNDYGMRVVKDRDNSKNNTQGKHMVGDKAKRTVGDKKKNKHKYYKPKQPKTK